MKTIIFARVSSKEQEESGFSLPSQLKLLKDYAENRGMSVDKSYSISETASKRVQRKTFDEMMKYITKNNIKIIIFEKVDRVTRNLQDSVKIYDWLEGDPERQLHCIKDSLILHKGSRSQEKLNWDIRVVMAKNYADNLSEEVRKGYSEKIAQKIYPGKPKLGYYSTGRGQGREILQDPTKAPILKQLLEDFSTGEFTAERLMQRANEVGLTNDFKRKLSATRTYNYIIDPFYYGYFLWNGNLYEGKHEPLISKDTYDRNQRILKRVDHTRFRIHDHTYKGIVQCGECKKIITWYEKKGRVYGECNSKDNLINPCTQKKCGREDLIHNVIISILESFQIYDKNIIEAIKDELMRENEGQKEVERLNVSNATARVEQIRTAINIAYEDRLNGLITTDKYRDLEKRYREEEVTLSKRIEGIRDGSDKQKEIGVALFDLSQHGERIYLKATNEDKRALLKIMFTELSILNGDLHYEINPDMLAIKDNVFKTNKILEQSSGVVKITNFVNEKPELGKECVVINKMGYEQLVNSVIRNGRGSNPQPSQ